MNKTPLVVLALLVAVVAGAVVIGGDALLGGDGADSDSFPTATAAPGGTTQTTDGGDAARATADVTATPTPPFGFVIEDVEECGTTCRNVTTTLTNQQDSTAEDVTVYSRIFAGRGTDGDEVWRGEEGVGTLGAGESYTTTREVDLGVQAALKVQNEDGWITIQTTVETADRTVTFTEQRQVL
jgi:hypothetical protein